MIWLPLESNPDVMNKCLKELGVPEKWGISDVISFDEEFVNMVPSPCLALLLLFPWTPKYFEHTEKQEELLKGKQEEVDGVYYMKQTIKNGCGTIALIHAVANNESHLNLQPESALKKFLNLTRNLTPEEKGKELEQNMDISTAHESSAQEGQTETPNIDDDVNLHFIALVNVNGKLLELDGRKFGPIVHGSTSEKTFVKDAFRVCKEYMAREPENLNFNALTFGAL